MRSSLVTETDEEDNAGGLEESEGSHRLAQGSHPPPPPPPTDNETIPPPSAVAVSLPHNDELARSIEGEPTALLCTALPYPVLPCSALLCIALSKIQYTL